jgi:serine/threonine-protein phosphatase 2A regulatory subunit B'
MQRSYMGAFTLVHCSIINGFAVPIKDEHKAMLIKALIPLHKAKNVVPYHPHLSYCMALYASKDHELTRDIIIGLLKFWPFGNSQKQIMFLNELEDLFEYVQVCPH